MGQSASSLPRKYKSSNWPRSLKVAMVILRPENDYVMVVKKDWRVLSPNVPLNQLSRFLNGHVDGVVERLVIDCDVPGGRWNEEMLPRMFDTVRPERFETISLHGFFRHLPWPTVQRVFDSEQMMRAKSLIFNDLRLPCGVEPRAFLQELDAVRECGSLSIHLNCVANPPRFSNAVLFEWLKMKERDVSLPQEYLADGVKSLVAFLKEDFEADLPSWTGFIQAFVAHFKKDSKMATQRHGYTVKIRCQDVKGVVRSETLTNAATGEKLDVSVDVDPKGNGEFSLVTITRRKEC